MFWGFKILSFIILFFFGGGAGSRKINYFWGHKDFVDIFVGHHKIGLYLGVISMHFRVFSLRPCHTTTYSTNVCRSMKNSASTLAYAEYVRNKF